MVLYLFVDNLNGIVFVCGQSYWYCICLWTILMVLHLSVDNL